MALEKDTMFAVDNILIYDVLVEASFARRRYHDALLRSELDL